jgi:hypothetical protein
MKKRCIFNNNFIKSKKAQMHVVMAIMLIAILLATVVFFWRTSEDFSQSYSKNIDEKSFQNIATYIENTVAHNEIAWIERTLVQTNMVIPLTYDGQKYIGENEFFRIEYNTSKPNLLSLSSKDILAEIKDTKNVYLNTRFYIDGNYNIYSNPTIPALKDKNIIGDFFLFKIEPMVSGRSQEYIVHLTPTFKSAVIGDAGQPPESLAKSCFLLEYPKSNWSEYYNSDENTYSVYPSNYFIVNSKDNGIDGRYINYYTNIFIPSDSEMIDSLSESSTKDILNNYIKSGGSLIMLSQTPTQKKKYDFLPVNITFDIGKYDTIGVSKQHNITQNLEPYEIAGSYYSANATILDPFVDGPANEILLREVPYSPYLNNNPSLILSNWGAGKVVATTIPIDTKSVLDTKVRVCKWWDPGVLGQGYDWHFRRLVIVDSGNFTRVNEPIEIVIDPTADINELAKEEFLELENIHLDLNSIRVVELLEPDYCSNKVSIPSQSYMYRPNLEHPRYQCAPLDTLTHTLFFELDKPANIKVVMTLPTTSYSKDEQNINNEIRVKVNNVSVMDPIDFQTEYEIANNRPAAGYWNAQDGTCSGGQGCLGPRHYEIEIPDKYFHKGDNKIALSMEHLTGDPPLPPSWQNDWADSLTWYRNVEFTVYYYNETNSSYELTWKEYQPMHVYFSMGATATHSGETPGTSNSVTPKGSKRYYEIYFDIENTNPSNNKPIPIYRTESDLVSFLSSWGSPKYIDREPSFPSISGIPSMVYPHIQNISSPSTKDIDGDGDIDIIIGLRDGNIALIDGPTGNIIWKKPFDKPSEPTGNNPVTAYGLAIVGSPAVVDIDNDDLYEIIGGSVNFVAVINTSGNNRYVNLSLGDTNITVLDNNGNPKWKVPVIGSVVSAPAIADINNDGYKDIVVQTLQATGIRYQWYDRPNIRIRINPSSDYDNRTVTLTNRLYVISGNPNPDGSHSILWSAIESPGGTYRLKYFIPNPVNSNRLDLMFPSSSPAVGDLDGNDNGLLEIVMGNVDGYAYKYENSGPPNRTKSSISSSITGDFSALLGYIVSSPTITRTDNQKNHDDAIFSFLRDGGDQLYIYILDGQTFIHTEITEINDQAAKHPAGHPVVHWPEGYHHRGPQVTIPMGNYICIEHLAQTHTVFGNITQAGTTNRTQSYATPVIIESNRYSTDIRTRETGRFDIILGAENGYLYSHAYTDTDGGTDEGNNEAQISFDNKIKRLWTYYQGSPIRSSVAVDDIDNDGKSEVILIAEDGTLSALKISDNYSSWNTERGNLYRTGDTKTKNNLPTYTMALTENINYGDSLDPYDDKFRVNADFNLSYPNDINRFDAYINDNWIKIDANHNNDVSDELVLYKKDLTRLNLETYEGRLVDKNYQIESIFGDIIKGEYIVTYFDRGIIKLFNNIMAYTSAPTKNIQIEEGIWVNLDLPNTIGTREYIIEGTGTHLTIYDPYNADVKYIKELRGMKIYGTISSSSKNKYVVITSYGAYLSPNPQEG